MKQIIAKKKKKKKESQYMTGLLCVRLWESMELEDHREMHLAQQE